MPMHDPDLAADLAQVRRARVYFYHHSVGENVIAGLQALDASAGGGSLTVTAVEDGRWPAGPGLLHGGGGLNGNPTGKMDAFARALTTGAPPVDLAFMKLCYVDVTPETDVEALFASYVEKTAALRRARPDVRIAHVTVPLQAHPGGAKAMVKRLLGRLVWEDETNARRAALNEKLRTAFPGEPLLDLAALESSDPDGRPVEFELRGRRYPSLYAGYTDDGGHLNAVGQRKVAAAAIRVMAEALRAPAVGEAVAP